MTRIAFHRLAILALASTLASAAGASSAQPTTQAASTGAPVAPQGPTPKVVYPETVFDAGVVVKGNSIEHEFEVKNEGTAVLEVTNVTSTCGCTVADYDRTIAPGKSGKIKVVVDSSTFAGPTSKAVVVYTNDPVTPRASLTVKCDVRPHIRVNPGYARYISVQGEAQGTIKQVMWAADKFADLVVSKVESPYPHVRVSFREATAEERKEDGEGRQWVVEMTLASDAPVGALTEYVKIHTNHPGQKVVTIPVSGFVRPVLAATPHQVDIGSRKLEEAYKTAAFIRNFATEAINLGAASVDVPGVTAEVVPVTEGRSYNLLLTFGPTVAKGALRGKVEIKTDSAKVPMLVVPLEGTVE